MKEVLVFSSPPGRYPESTVRSIEAPTAGWYGDSEDVDDAGGGTPAPSVRVSSRPRAERPGVGRRVSRSFTLDAAAQGRDGRQRRISQSPRILRQRAGLVKRALSAAAAALAAGGVSSSDVGDGSSGCGPGPSAGSPGPASVSSATVFSGAFSGNSGCTAGSATTILVTRIPEGKPGEVGAVPARPFVTAGGLKPGEKTRVWIATDTAMDATRTRRPCWRRVSTLARSDVTGNTACRSPPANGACTRAATDRNPHPFGDVSLSAARGVARTAGACEWLAAVRRRACAS